jgi:hypothetical protein
LFHSFLSVASLFPKMGGFLIVLASALCLHKAVGAPNNFTHEDITVIDLCSTGAMDTCAGTSRVLNFPTVTSTPSYSWNVTATLLADVVAPTYDVAIQLKENLPLPAKLSPPMGVDSGAACGVVKVPFGIGAKGNKSPWPCLKGPCHVALTFPPCPWKAGTPLLVKGEFKMGWFLREIFTVPNMTVNVTVRGNGGRVIDLTTHQHPSSKPVWGLDSVIV